MRRRDLVLALDGLPESETRQNVSFERLTVAAGLYRTGPLRRWATVAAVIPAKIDMLKKLI